jgi:FkbM family methyltransferase
VVLLVLGVVKMNTGVGEGDISREKKVIGSPVDRVGVATSKSSIQELNSDPSSQLRIGTAKEWTNIVDWKEPFTKEEESKFKCDFVEFISASTGKSAQMCVHPFRDIVSVAIKRRKRWEDCNVLPTIWNSTAKPDHDKSGVYVEIGANIGACVMEMLLGTDANIIAFEPHPMNLFNLKKSVSKLDPVYQNRLKLIPVGLGNEKVSSTIFSANNNMGNSVIGKIIKDVESQQFSETLQFTINVERLDSILDRDVDVKLMKMDAQGFECNILDGMGDFGKNVEAVKFEWAPKWLDGQNCTDLLPRFRKYGFDLYKRFDSGSGSFTYRIDQDNLRKGHDVVNDVFAVKGESKRFTAVKG